MNCPVSTPIPKIISLFKESKIKEAGQILFDNNPLSAICSIVCPHERNCEGNCIVGIKSNAVEFYKIEQYISKLFIETYEPDTCQKNLGLIAVVGAGPAGIAMSLILSRKGYKVTLIEAKDQIGGILRFGIPDFRLPKDIVDKYGDILFKMGVKFKPNTFVGSTLMVDDMFLDGYDAVFIAVGTSRPNKIGLLGETLGNVHYAIDYLKSPDTYHIGKKIVVIGAGNVALDAARMAIRKIGNGEVILVNNRREEDMTGRREEIKMAKIDGVKFFHCLQVVKLTETGILCARVTATEKNGEACEYDEDFTDTEFIEADTIIIAIGQGPQSASLANTVARKTFNGFFEIDEGGHTSHKGVFAAGDIVSGSKTVVEAVAFTRKVAEAINEYCINKRE
jgi:glutamate synthase (NADPH/NADH) small chain